VKGGIRDSICVNINFDIFFLFLTYLFFIFLKPCYVFPFCLTDLFVTSIFNLQLLQPANCWSNPLQHTPTCFNMLQPAPTCSNTIQPAPRALSTNVQINRVTKLIRATLVIYLSFVKKIKLKII